MAADWLLYGAYGYTGRLIAYEAVARGERLVLAGRREAPLRELAERLDLPWRVFGLDDPDALDHGLEGVAAVLLAAGPFAATSRPVVDACLRNRVHYLDVTGEIAVFESIFARDAEARERGVVLLPGVGFDVVPTDCLAASLAEALPGASRLDLAFASLGGSPGPGTAKTMVEGLGQGGAVRQSGRIRSVPLAWKRAEIPFADRPRTAMTIPWGDVATSYRSTGIPNVVTWMAVPDRIVRGMKLGRPVARLLRFAPLRWVARSIAERLASGPDEEQRRESRSQVWGHARHADGRSVQGTAQTPGGHALTATAAVASVVRVGAGITAGARTPSLAFGAGFLEELPGCRLRVGEVLDTRKGIEASDARR